MHQQIYVLCRIIIYSHAGYHSFTACFAIGWQPDLMQAVTGGTEVFVFCTVKLVRNLVAHGDAREGE